ncbi:hypothetical protein TSUD_325830 [Trifolium subterraneum]|uniref:RNase H type-1 domain-containing protein n=1 Tax=Trifolium subterraneum TaxID=3900 RepID=A0A2Z6LI14_TRISU|nr:hypothetical protein TSUD_325830 [Trifolium subterraneum]
MDVYDWLKLGATGSRLIFSADVWWSLRHHNPMCLNNETWSLSRLSFNIQAMVETYRHCFSPASKDGLVDRYIKWNNNNYFCVILNVDESCLGSPIRSRFGGIIRNTFGHYLAGFSGFIPRSSDILLVGLYAIYKSILLPKDMNIDDLACNSDSLHCVNLIKGPRVSYHIHAVLIPDINESLSQINVSLNHTLTEGNQCADLFAKLKASLDADFLTHVSPLEDVRDLLRNDTIKTFFLRE